MLLLAPRCCLCHLKRVLYHYDSGIDTDDIAVGVAVVVVVVAAAALSQLLL